MSLFTFKTNCAVFVICCLLVGCTNRIIKPNPQSGAIGPSSKIKNQTKVYACNTKKIDTSNEIDFATAFDTGEIKATPPKGSNNVGNPEQIFSLRYPPYKVDRQNVRVALKQNVTRASFYSLGNVELHPHKGKIQAFRGRCFAQFVNSSELEVEAVWGKVNVQMPCTLVSTNELNLIDVEGDSYRGSIILNSCKSGSFTIINDVPVEEYLRGVVPLEIGKLSDDANEALKAQAIAARTYTYQRIQEQALGAFDLLATTADQVYGGANVEYRGTDLAIRLTKNLILIYNDSIAKTYYHSTCGGHTANIEDVWKNKPPLPYLRSESDLDSSGNAYCLGSRYFRWEEIWTKQNFSKSVCQNLNVIEPKSTFKGLISNIRITGTFDCGRIKSCKISGSDWTYDCGGDLVRSIFRRPAAGGPILRSARFTVTDYRSNNVKFSGSGYGHGVGMCQFGAIGRAKKGQMFEEILGAYYRGIVICTATTAK